MHGRFNSICFLVLIAFGSSAVLAQGIDPPLSLSDPERFTGYFADHLRAAFPRATIVLAAKERLRFTAPSRAAIDVDVAAPRRICLFSGTDPKSCADDAIQVTIKTLRVADPQALHLALAKYDPENYGAITVPLAMGWTKFAFGALEMKCFKGDPQEEVAINSWDALLLNISMREVGTLCLNAGRAALGSLETAIGSPVPENVNRISGRLNASLAIFSKEWASLATNWGELIIATPDSNTILFSRGGSADAVTRLRKAAQAVVDGQSPSDTRLTSDVYRWTPGGWQAEQ